MSDTESSERFRCPGCEEEVDVAAESAGRLVRCPYCNTDFFASHDQAHLAVVDDTSETVEHDREAAFDKLRIENYTALRMGAIRARSWCLIGLFLASLLMLDMFGRAILYVWAFHKWGIEPSIESPVAVISLFVGKHAWKRAAEFKREINTSAIPEPTTPPDFSTLNNGTDRWKDLENVR